MAGVGVIHMTSVVFDISYVVYIKYGIFSILVYAMTVLLVGSKAE